MATVRAFALQLWLLLCVDLSRSQRDREAWLPETQLEREGRESCARRFRSTDFSQQGFQSEWLSPYNRSAFIDCLYKLRTRWRPREKSVHAGGIHYPTLITTHHTWPPVSTSGARLCWLDELGVSRNSIDPGHCCDTAHGPRGLEECWDDYFNYELCCLGDVNVAEMPHFFVAPAFDINVGNSVRQLGTFDLGQSYALQTLCRTGDAVIDVGANVGGFTVPLAERVGPDGEVHAFEPFRKVFQHLNANVALNGLSNVYTYNVALGTKEEEVDAFVPDLTSFNFPSAIRVLDQFGPDKAAKEANLRYEPRQETLTVRPLDNFKFGKRISLIKIDVEFMEWHVVRGARQTIKQNQPLIWVENEAYFDDPANLTFVNTMYSDLGYVCNPVARLELLCSPGKESGGQLIADESLLPAGFKRVFRHLSGEFKDVHLWRALSEAAESGESAQPVDMAAEERSERGLQVTRGSPPRASTVRVLRQSPAAEDVLVRVQVAALTPTDVLLCQRALIVSKADQSDAATFVPGTFFAGKVLAFGDLVQGLRIGELVLGIVDPSFQVLRGSSQEVRFETASSEEGGCYRETVSAHFSMLLPLDCVDPKLPLTALVAHVPPMISALMCMASLRLRPMEALLLIAPSLDEIAFLLQRLLISSWHGPLYMVLLSGPAPSRQDLQQHPLLQPLVPSAGRSFLDDMLSISIQARAQLAVVLAEIVTEVLTTTGGLGVEAVLAVDVDLCPDKDLVPELSTDLDAACVALEPCERPPAVLRTLVGALAMRGRLLTNCERFELSPDDGHHLWAKECSVAFVNPHCLPLSGSRHGELLHAAIEICGKIAAGELAIAESEVAQFYLFDQFQQALDVMSAKRERRGVRKYSSVGAGNRSALLVALAQHLQVSFYLVTLVLMAAIWQQIHEDEELARRLYAEEMAQLEAVTQHEPIDLEQLEGRGLEQERFREPEPAAKRRRMQECEQLASLDPVMAASHEEREEVEEMWACWLRGETLDEGLQIDSGAKDSQAYALHAIHALMTEFRKSPCANDPRCLRAGGNLQPSTLNSGGERRQRIYQRCCRRKWISGQTLSPLARHSQSESRLGLSESEN
eukprot:s514_g23.t3